MSDYVSVCRLAELHDRVPRSVVIDGEPVVVVRVGDEVFALDDVCSHAEIPLSEGDVDDDATISCWLHGSRFDLRTGEPLDPPAWASVTTYAAHTEDRDGAPTVCVRRSPNHQDEQEQAV